MTEKKETYLKKTFNYALKHSLTFFRSIVIFLIALYLLSGIYSVSQNEIGVYQRFGRIINEKVQPGIHYKLPWPFDTITKVPVRKIKRMVIDDFRYSTFNVMTGLDSYCITGDNNLVTISCIIQYTITNPREYLFSVNDPDGMLKSLASRSILHSMASKPIDEILTRGKQSVARHIMAELQKKLDKVKAGINISFVEIDTISPPTRVEQYFSDVVKASIDREKNINEAESYRNEILPRAKAEAMEEIEKAEAYKKEVALIAEGKTGRFNKLLERVREKESSAWELLYIEAMTEVMENIGHKHIINNSRSGEPAANLKIKVSQ